MQASPNYDNNQSNKGGKMISTDKLGITQANFTVIKDGVDLKERFHNVLDNHPLTYHWSDGVKSMIVIKLFDEVIKEESE